MSIRTHDFEIYTDGSFLPKSGRGSWAFVLNEISGRQLESSGTAKKTTSNRMEFQAAIEALKRLPLGANAVVFSDSRNLIDTMTLWMPEFKAAAWKKKSGRPIPDTDLIQQLDSLTQEKILHWKWIKAHAGNTLNERCDFLCDEALSRTFHG